MEARTLTEGETTLTRFGVDCPFVLRCPACHQALPPGRVPQVRTSVPGLKMVFSNAFTRGVTEP